MTTYSTPMPTRLSKSALSSFICGLLGCVPFITGVMAILLGIIGLVRTGDPTKRGRWMAVVGILLGLLSIAGWTLSGGGLLAAWRGLTAPGAAAHAFMQDLAAGDMTGAKAHSAGLSDDDLRDDAALISSHGTFVDTTFNNVNISNSDANVSGTAAFNTGTIPARARLTYSGGAWRVTHIELGP